ncbi:MAG TPA: MotA/TolQ/ExbB proton channel family protein [Lacipirellulaceae bacterium]|nr:MotA/TolQ/ExbB proton channel family protein [Lacipirellulaceae bacterium]
MVSLLLLQFALLAQVAAPGDVGADPAVVAPAPAEAPAAAPPAATGAAASPAAEHEPGLLTGILLKLTMVGAEWVLWLLVLLSIVSVALIVERVLYFYNHRVDGEQLGQQVEQLLGEGNVRGVWDLVNGSDCIEHEVIAAGLPALRRGATACSEAMLAAKARLKPILDSRLSVLATIGSNAPFVGLLGTVLGIVKAANDLAGAGAGQGDPNAVMAGVFEALVATAVGLFVAIPAVVAFNLLQRRVRTTLSQVDALAHLVLANVRVDSKKGSAAPDMAPPVVARTT